MTHFIDAVRNNNKEAMQASWAKLTDAQQQLCRNERRDKWYNIGGFNYQWGALHYAVHHGNEEIFMFLLDNQFIPFADNDGKYPIEYAAKGSKWSLVEIFIRYGYADNVTQFPTVIIKALAEEKLQIFHTLLAKIPQETLRQEKFSALLGIAVRQNNMQVVKELLHKGISQRTTIRAIVQGKKNDLPLVVYAATHGQWDMLSIFADYPTDNYREAYGLAAIIAAEAGQLYLAKKLIDANADVTVRLQTNNHTLLFTAIKKWHEDEELFNKVVARGVDFSQRCANNVYPVQLALTCPNRNVIPALLAAGAEAGAFPNPNGEERVTEARRNTKEGIINHANRHQWSDVKKILDWISAVGQILPDDLLGNLLHLAIEQHLVVDQNGSTQNRSEEIRYLLSKGANQAFRNSEGLTTWQVMTKLCHFDLMNIFLSFAFNPEEVAAASVLLTLCRFGHFTLANNLLIGHNFNTNQVIESSYQDSVLDINGKTRSQPVPNEIVGYSALHFAIKNGAPSELIRLLIDRGSNLQHAASADDLTPFRLAANMHKDDIIEILLDAANEVVLEEKDFKLLLDIAERNTPSGWQCIFVILGYEQRGVIQFADRYSYYQAMQKFAIEQNNGDAVRRLSPVCLRQNIAVPVVPAVPVAPAVPVVPAVPVAPAVPVVPAVPVAPTVPVVQNVVGQDRLGIVHAARRNEWEALEAILPSVKQHHQPRDLLLALYYSVQQSRQNNINRNPNQPRDFLRALYRSMQQVKQNWLAGRPIQARDFLLALYCSEQQIKQNGISKKLIDLISNQIEEWALSENDLVLSKLSPAHLGYDLLKFAVHYHNDEMMTQCLNQNHGDLNPYIEVAFNYKNQNAVKELAKRGAEPRLQTLLAACKDQDGWILVEEFFNSSSLIENHLMDVILQLRNVVNDYPAMDRNYLDRFKYRREIGNMHARGYEVAVCMLAMALFSDSPITSVLSIMLLAHIFCSQQTFSAKASHACEATKEGILAWDRERIGFFATVNAAGNWLSTHWETLVEDLPDDWEIPFIGI